MKFSLFFEMQQSEPTRASEAQHFHDCVSDAVLAEELGYHCIWAVEHHGLYEYSHSSAPEVFLAFVAAKTKRIRIGHGVTLTPWRYDHPMRVAERIATLDILSKGRVSWGSGKSASRVEQVAYQHDIETLHEQWLEALHIIPRMWQEDVFSFKGRFVDIAPINVLPKPVQQPHPPMFAACTKPDSAAAIGRLGIGAMNFAVGNDRYLTEKVTEYRRAVEASNPTGWKKNNHFSCTPQCLVLPDDREACRYGLRGARFFAEAMAAYYWTTDRPTSRLPIDRTFFSEEDLDAIMANRNQEGSALINIIGDPASAREGVQRFVDAGVDELILVMHMGTVPHEVVRRSIKTFAEEVMPHFA